MNLTSFELRLTTSVAVTGAQRSSSPKPKSSLSTGHRKVRDTIGRGEFSSIKDDTENHRDDDDDNDDGGGRQRRRERETKTIITEFSESDAEIKR